MAFTSSDCKDQHDRADRAIFRMLKFADSGELDIALDKLNPSVDRAVAFLQHAGSRLLPGDSSCVELTCVVL